LQRPALPAPRWELFERRSCCLTNFNKGRKMLSFFSRFQSGEGAGAREAYAVVFPLTRLCINLPNIEIFIINRLVCCYSNSHSLKSAAVFGKHGVCKCSVVYLVYGGVKFGGRLKPLAMLVRFIEHPMKTALNINSARIGGDNLKQEWRP